MVTNRIIIIIIIIIASMPRIVPWRTERMPQRIQRHSRVTLHRSTHPKWKQEQTKKSSYGPDRIQKGIWYGSAKLDNKLSKNVQNITRSHKLHKKKNMKNWGVELTAGGKKPGWNKDPKRYFLRRCTITPTIHNYHDATKPHTQKMHGRIQIC